MLAEHYRLKGKFYVERAKKKGKLFQFKHFGMCVLKSKNDLTKPSQFGFVISKKVSKLAVDRNRVKRMISESVRFQLANLKPGFEVVFLAKPSIMREPTENVMHQVKEALKKAHLLKKA